MNPHGRRDKNATKNANLAPSRSSRNDSSHLLEDSRTHQTVNTLGDCRRFSLSWGRGAGVRASLRLQLNSFGEGELFFN